MAARNRKKKQGCMEVEFLSPKKEDPWALVRKLEAQLAQEKFYHDKTKTENQYEIKTLQAKVRSLEKQKKIFLEKLEQNPIEQQNKLEKELNDTSRQLRETTQRLVTTQQQVEKLLRSNRSIKKAREKMAEEFEKEMKQKNSLIHNLEERIRDLKISCTDAEAHNRTEPEEDNGFWQPNDTMELWDKSDVGQLTVEMWDNSDDDVTQVDEEKGRSQDPKNMDAFKTLEEKDQTEGCRVSFFPSMYDCNGNNKNKVNVFCQKGFQNDPVTLETSKAHMNEQTLCDENQTLNENSIMIDETQSQGFKLNFDEGKAVVNIQEAKPSIPPTKLKCWTKAKMENMAKLCSNKGCSHASDSINRLKNFYSKISLGSKADAAEGIPDSSGTGGLQKIGTRSPPPGFNTMDIGPVVHAGIDFFNPSCFDSEEYKTITQNVK